MTQSEMGQRNSAGNSTDLFDASIDRCLSGSPEVLGAAADVMSSIKPYGSRFHSQCSGPDQHILDVLLSSSTVTLPHSFFIQAIFSSAFSPARAAAPWVAE